MAASDWWLPELPNQLDQGDIFRDIAFIESVVPQVALKATSMKAGAQGWMKDKVDPVEHQKAHWLATGHLSHGLLLNHGCDIDKPNNRRCIFVPVFLLTRLPAEQHEGVVTQQSIPMLYLPDVPGFGDMVADFRIVMNVARAQVIPEARVASMTEDARFRMLAQLVKFFTRTDFNRTVSGSES